jgi:Glycosyltransferase family 87
VRTSTKKNPSSHIIVFLCFSALALFNVRLLWMLRDRILAGYGDFGHFYASALIVRRGDGHRLYDYERQRQIQSRLFPDVETRPEPLIFNHMAYETLLWLPLTFFSYSAAVLLWTLMNFAVLVALSLSLARRFHYARGAMTLPWILPFLATFPVLNALIQGQDSIILLLIYAITFSYLERDKMLLAGVVLALGLFKFHLVLPFLGFFLLQHRWRFASGFALGSLIPLGFSLYIAGTGGMMGQFRFLIQSNQNVTSPGDYGLYPMNMPNIRGLLYSALSTTLEKETLFAITAVLSIILLWVFARTSRNSTLDLQFALGILATLLVSYHLFSYDLAISILPLLILITRIAGRRSPQRRLGWAVLISCGALLLTTPVYLIILGYGIHGSLMVIPLLMLTLLASRLRPVLSDQITGPALSEGTNA